MPPKRRSSTYTVGVMRGLVGLIFQVLRIIWGKAAKGRLVLKRKTSKKKFTAALTKMYAWIKQNRHKPIGELIKLLNAKLRGHYTYYGITLNSRSPGKFHKEVERALIKWINRRGGKRFWPWYEKLIYQWIPTAKT